MFSLRKNSFRRRRNSNLPLLPMVAKGILTDSVNKMKEVESMEQKSHKSKGGRPPKKVKRDAQLMVRLSETERFLIETKSREAGLRPSTWLRQTAKKARVIGRLSAEEAGFIRMLAGLANNLNQLLRFTNMQGLLYETKKATQLLSDIDHLLKKLTSDDR